MTHQIIITFSGAVFFGIIFIILSHRLKIPPIVLLLFGGILIGPGAFGLNIINPSHLGAGFNAIIQLAVGLILFEGGLNLDVKGYRSVSDEIKSSLTVGVLITWFLSAAAIKYLFEFQWLFSILAGSLIIVTGPTVIGPLLKKIGVHKKIHNFLHWEGVLIDPIGVFIALLCYEWIIGANAIAMFAFRLTTGLITGLLSGYFLSKIIKKRLIRNEDLNIFVLACALGIFTISDIIVPESGLMSIAIAGFFVGYSNPPEIEKLKLYKEQLIDLLIGLLFMLLAANLDIESFNKHYGIKMIIAVVVVMIIVRPVNIFASTLLKKNFTFKEKLFLSWVAPRGIVAASMASLFTMNLKRSGIEGFAQNADFLEAFTFSIIFGTVIIQGFTAKPVGKLLNVLEPKATGWLIIGAHRLAQIIADFIKKVGFEVTLIDTNIRLVAVAKRNKLSAICENAITIEPDRFPELYGIGNVLAITENEDLNELACQYWAGKLKDPGLYRWCSAERQRSMGKSAAQRSGKPVWLDVQLNKLIDMINEDKDLSFTTVESDAKKIRHPERVLMCYNKGYLTPHVSSRADGRSLILSYHPFAVDVGFNIKPGCVVFSEAGDFAGVLKQLLACMTDVLTKDAVDRVFNHIIEREKEYSSVIGYNVALPHTYIDGIEDSVVLFAKLKYPIKCRFNEDVISYIFLVLSPRSKPQNHIKTLSEISKFIVNDDNRFRLFNASSEEELIEIFTS